MSEEKLNMRDETLLIRTRLERVALTADIASHYVQDMRVMPASGVARVAWDAMDHIDAMEVKLREAALSELSALGQASDAHDAQKAAEAKLALARRDALEEAAEVAIRMEREMEVQDECGNEPFYTPEDVAQRIRATIAAIKGAD